jgi:hypothetical protein
MLYLTYNNTICVDGAGSQLSRMLDIYLTAKYFNVGYIHTPIAYLDYCGLVLLERNDGDQSQVQQYNNLFTFPSHTFSGIFDEEYEVPYITLELIHMASTIPKNILLKVSWCSKIDKQYYAPILNVKKPYLPWVKTVYDIPVIIAVHVRRGELYVVDSQRMLPNSYYIEIMQALESLFVDVSLAHEFHIYTEVATKDIIVTPTHHGICNRISSNITITPSVNKVEELNCVKNCKFFINTSPVDAMKDFINSHFLITSNSCFSRVPAVLKNYGIAFTPNKEDLNICRYMVVNTREDIHNNKMKILLSLLEKPV